MTPSCPTPSIKRRLIAMVYETFLLLAVEMLAVALFLLVTATATVRSPTRPDGALFLVTGAYFVYNWTNSGHTLAMKTWRLCVVAGADARVSVRTAALRYLFAWGWLVPAFAVRTLFGLHSKGAIAAVYGAGIAAWALTAFLDKDRQFLHDRLAGTRLVQLPKALERGRIPDTAAARQSDQGRQLKSRRPCAGRGPIQRHCLPPAGRSAPAPRRRQRCAGGAGQSPQADTLAHSASIWPGTMPLPAKRSRASLCQLALIGAFGRAARVQARQRHPRRWRR
jgi:uncharacterized RDD family membrane protein YckC